MASRSRWELPSMVAVMGSDAVLGSVMAACDWAAQVVMRGGDHGGVRKSETLQTVASVFVVSVAVL